jgi:hypothetical protein
MWENDIYISKNELKNNKHQKMGKIMQNKN